MRASRLALIAAVLAISSTVYSQDSGLVDGRVVGLAYTALFGAVAGWGLWFWLIARCSMTRVAPFALLQIVFAIVAGVVFLHEPLTPTLVAGAVICIVGVAITQSRFFARYSLPTAPRAPAEPIQCL